jgi:hypothetical protein
LGHDRVEAALAEQLAYYRRAADGHAWGKIVCPSCQISWVWSTPKNPGNHARDLRHKVDRCLER